MRAQAAWARLTEQELRAQLRAEARDELRRSAESLGLLAKVEELGAVKAQLSAVVGTVRAREAPNGLRGVATGVDAAAGVEARAARRGRPAGDVPAVAVAVAVAVEGGAACPASDSRRLHRLT